MMHIQRLPHKEMLFQAGYALFSPADAVVSLKTSEFACITASWAHMLHL